LAEDEVLAFHARAEEIQKLVQQIAQNIQHRFDDTILQAGTTVNLKTEGLLGK
jgi:hypothetical protein